MKSIRKLISSIWSFESRFVLGETLCRYQLNSDSLNKINENKLILKLNGNNFELKDKSNLYGEKMIFRGRVDNFEDYIDLCGKFELSVLIKAVYLILFNGFILFSLILVITNLLVFIKDRSISFNLSDDVTPFLLISFFALAQIAHMQLMRMILTPIHVCKFLKKNRYSL